MNDEISRLIISETQCVDTDEWLKLLGFPRLFECSWQRYAGGVDAVLKMEDVGALANNEANIYPVRLSPSLFSPAFPSANHITCLTRNERDGWAAQLYERLRGVFGGANRAVGALDWCAPSNAARCLL